VGLGCIPWWECHALLGLECQALGIGWAFPAQEKRKLLKENFELEVETRPLKAQLFL